MGKRMGTTRKRDLDDEAHPQPREVGQQKARDVKILHHTGH